MISFDTKLAGITGIGPKINCRLESLGLQTVGDLLYHFPHRYEDFSNFKKINELTFNEKVTLQGQIEKVNNKRTWKRRMMITEAIVKDETGSIKAVWFNLPAPAQYLAKGKMVQLSGKVTLNKENELILQHPNIEIIRRLNENAQTSANTGGLTPVYPETRGLNSYWLRRMVKKLINQAKPEEILPRDILKSQQLLNVQTALEQIHFPSSQRLAEEAKKRFAFEKMFLLQLKALQVKKNWEKNQAQKILFDEKKIRQFVKSLPFQLTNAQKKSAWQIIRDLEKDQPMNRLLEGDVGSGKTVVAALAALSAINQHYQVALLAPTEVLAVQHFEGLKELLKGYNLALLTGSKKNKNAVYDDIATGKTQLVIGTHALLQKGVKFRNLALVIIDEQHRFGVGQRAHLQQKAVELEDGKPQTIPHLLTMTATPIPRTLSLAIFGNLDLSIIDEFPRGRKKILTRIIKKDKRDETYAFIRKEVTTGRQIFIICPLVEESSKLTELKAATEEFERLSTQVFPDLKLGLLHGRKKPAEKEEIMRKFKEKKYDILVSTSVVEVGVDVPNATIMLIEGAERFGLSQLHQFRGRVGRGEYQSYCFLFTSDNAPSSTQRLRAMEKTNDGFQLAREDLKLRGPGQLMGLVQSGLPDVAMQSLTDVKTIEAARLEAQRVLNFDPKLKKFPRLQRQLWRMETVTHLE